MRTMRIELEGRAGHVAIERQRGNATIRIDSVIANPGKGEQAWKTWEIDAKDTTCRLYLPRSRAWKTWEIDAKDTDDTERFWIATEIQRRCDGVVGTNSDVNGYLRELQRFVD